MKEFGGELERFEAMLRRREPFAMGRFGDGEIRIVRDRPTLYGDFDYDPAAARQRWYRDRLIGALRHRQPNYYVAISAPCCVGDGDFFVYRSIAGQREEALTFACLFVNRNYGPFLTRWLPLFATYDVHLVCHRDADPGALPFRVARTFRVGDNAWRHDYAVLDELRAYVTARGGEDALFLIAAGPFGGVVAQHLFDAAPRSTAIDIGSTLDPFLYGRATRPYHRGVTDHDFCTWAPARLAAGTATSSEGHHATDQRATAAV